MSKVDAIKAGIRQLSATEFAELRTWLLLEDAEAWDRQFESDAASGRLDPYFCKQKS